MLKKLQRISAIISLGLLLTISSTALHTTSNTLVATSTTASSPTCNLVLKYKTPDNSESSAGDNQIRPQFLIENMGTSSIALEEITVRYWYTAEEPNPQNAVIDWAAVGNSNVTTNFVNIAEPVTGANQYLEFGFTTGAGTLAVGGDSGPVQARFHYTNWANYDETDDYSYNMNYSSFQDWDKVTLYCNGVLAWGTEPDGGGGNGEPTAHIVATPTYGTAPLLVDFDAAGSTGFDNTTITYSWDFGDGNTGNGVTISHTYTAIGNYTATLTVSDGTNTDTETVGIDLLFSITDVPDPNFEQALIDLNIDGGTLDGIVNTNNINTLTSLDVHGKSIADLTGIEDFVALESLECGANQLQNLDVSNLSALKRLDCYHNQLQVLDVSMNTALERLDCSNNSISSLDVSAAAALIDLTCDHNELSILDLSNNAFLENLYCYKNNLTQLNVKNGNNQILKNFHAGVNQLDCINVDNAADASINAGIYSTWVYDNEEGANVQYSEACGLPLAVELLSFSAEKQLGQARLFWEMGTKLPSKSFQLEHSQDGRHFESLTEIVVTPSVHYYQYLHTSPSLGRNYYRLKLQELDGRFAYSSVIVMDWQQEHATLQIFPNPVDHDLSLKSPHSAIIYDIRIFNQLGQVVWFQQNLSSDIDVSTLPRGLYVLVAVVDGRSVRQSFVK